MMDKLELRTLRQQAEDQTTFRHGGGTNTDARVVLTLLDEIARLTATVHEHDPQACQHCSGHPL